MRFSTQTSSQVRRAFLRFDVPLQSGEAVTGATLRVYAIVAGSSQGVELRGVASNSWSETALTWSNQPARLLHGDGVEARFCLYAYIALDATALVKAAGAVSMALTTTGTTYQGFSSREEATARRPQLVVQTTAGPTPTPTPSPTARRPTPTPTPVPAPSGALHSTPAQAFVNSNGTPVPLHGFNVNPIWNDSVGNTWDKAKYDQIRAKGFNTVRFVLKWSDFEPTRGSFNPTHLTTLDTAVARAKAAGLYVILDCIHLFGSGGMGYVPAWAMTGDSVTTVQTNGGGYLKTLASRYRNEPAVAGYDLVNEPYRWPLDQNGVLRMYDSLIKQVRTVGPEQDRRDRADVRRHVGRRRARGLLQPLREDQRGVVDPRLLRGRGGRRLPRRRRSGRQLDVVRRAATRPPTSSSSTTTSSSTSRRLGWPGSPCGSASTGSQTARRITTSGSRTRPPC